MFQVDGIAATAVPIFALVSRKIAKYFVSKTCPPFGLCPPCPSACRRIQNHRQQPTFVRLPNHHNRQRSRCVQLAALSSLMRAWTVLRNTESYCGPQGPNVDSRGFWNLVAASTLTLWEQGCINFKPCNVTQHGMKEGCWQQRYHCP